MTSDKENLQMIQLPKIFLPIHKEDLLRVGSKFDGGYVLTKELVEKTEFLLSFGLSTDWTFEEDFLEKKKKKIKIHVYDHTVSGRTFRKLAFKSIRKLIRNPAEISNWKNIFKKISYRKFFDNVDVIHFKEKVWWIDSQNSISIKKIFERIDNKKIFLKMDIDGSEYRVIEQILQYHQKIIGMTIEFHEVDILYNVWIELLKKIKNYFNVVHIHANNFSQIGIKKIPNVWEITFENKKIFHTENKYSNYSYPIDGIDMPNNPNKFDFSIDFS